MVVGIVAGIAIVAVGVVSFVRDVDRLVRTGSGGDLVADLEAGEYFLYDEDDGVDLGPLDVRITRVDDGLGVVPTDVDDGPSYDIAGNSGSAALSFDLPTAGDYRIETTTGVGEIASFAIGRDVGGGPFAALTRGVLIGGAIFAVGLALTIWGAVQRGRARLRSRAELALDHGRRAVESTTEAIADPDQRRHVATHHGRRLGQTVTERTGEAPAPLREGLDGVTGRLEAAAGDLAASTEAPAELAGRLGDALGRAQDRLAAGEGLRSVARDSGMELRKVGSDARREAMGSYAATRSKAANARADADARRAAVVGRRDDLAAAAGASVERDLRTAERIAEETGAEIGAALDDAASDITAAAMRSAGAVNEEARAAIDAASAQLRAAAAIPSTSTPPPAPPVGAAPPPPRVPTPPIGSSGPPPPPPPSPPRPPAREGLPARGSEPSPSPSRDRVDQARPVPLAPPPTQRIPPGPGRPTGAGWASRETPAGDAAGPPATGFAALAPPPSAIAITHAPRPSRDAPTTATAGAAGHDEASEPDAAAIRRVAPLSALVLAPPPSGRRPDRSSGPGPAVPPG
jgi:hypothetical protein